MKKQKQLKKYKNAARAHGRCNTTHVKMVFNRLNDLFRFSFCRFSSSVVDAETKWTDCNAKTKQIAVFGARAFTLKQKTLIV